MLKITSFDKFFLKFWTPIFLTICLVCFNFGNLETFFLSIKIGAILYKNLVEFIFAIVMSELLFLYMLLMYSITGFPVCVTKKI